MTPPNTPPVLARSADAAPGAGPGGEKRFDGGPLWMRLLPSLVMLGLALWDITGPSYWRDEGATLAAVQRPFVQLVRMMGHVDGVHGVYYMIIWPLVRIAGTGEIVTRLPSALAMTVAAGLVAAIGRRLVSLPAGLAAGLVFAVLPQISLYGQDARSYAMVTAFGTAGSYLLLRAIGTPGRRRGWLTGYAACMAVMGALNIFGILLLAAHAVTVALACLRQDDGRIRASLAGLRGEQEEQGGKSGAGGAGGAARSLALGWLAAAVAAVFVASPILLLGIEQRGTASWIKAPGPGTITSLWRLVGPLGMVTALCLFTACGLVASALTGRAALRASWPAMLPAMTIPWLLIPPALLIGVSFAIPLYVPRYVLYCLPAVALLAGAGLAALGEAVGTGLGRAPQAGLAPLGWLTGAVALLVIALLGSGVQVSERGPAITTISAAATRSSQLTCGRATPSSMRRMTISGLLIHTGWLGWPTSPSTRRPPSRRRWRGPSCRPRWSGSGSRRSPGCGWSKCAIAHRCRCCKDWACGCSGPGTPQASGCSFMRTSQDPDPCSVRRTSRDPDPCRARLSEGFTAGIMGKLPPPTCPALDRCAHTVAGGHQ